MTPRDTLQQRLAWPVSPAWYGPGWLARVCADRPIALSLIGHYTTRGAGRRGAGAAPGGIGHAARPAFTGMETAAETAEASGKDDIAITPWRSRCCRPCGHFDRHFAGRSSNRVGSTRHFARLLAVVGLASYIILALGAKGAKWLTPMAEKIMTRLMGLFAGRSCRAILVNGLKGEGGLLQH